MIFPLVFFGSSFLHLNLPSTVWHELSTRSNACLDEAMKIILLSESSNDLMQNSKNIIWLLVPLDKSFKRESNPGGLNSEGSEITPIRYVTLR